jgi:phosphoesterase RecJ-like protein
MNYEDSKRILEEVEKAKKVLVNCHRSPDPDSVGSAISVYLALTGMGKDVTIVCPSDLPPDVLFLSLTEKIKKIDYLEFDFSKYDLFISLDSGSFDMVTGRKDIEKPKIPIIVIDHHKTNHKYGIINLVDDNVSSTAEMLYLVFEDWKVEIDKDIAQALLTGILADTGVFEYGGVTPRTLGIAQRLMEKGVDKDEITLNVFHSVPFNKVRFWGEILRRIEIEKEHGFVWAAVPHEVYLEYEKPLSAKEMAASLFFQSVEGTDFGMVMVEEQKKVLSISFRSRTNFDVSRVAERLGGGGHKAAAGAKVYGLDFEKAVEKVLIAAREIVNENEN